MLLVLARGALRSPIVVFVSVTAIAQGAACWIVPDLPLGYARDWDLFAPTGVVFLSAAAVIMLSMMRADARPARLLGVALVVSLFHTVPWIALNASEERSLERFKTLPLGRGRTESTVGFWYFAQGNLPQAKVWLNRALQDDPGNVRALAHLGNIHLSEQRYDLAAESFARAVELRPNQPHLRHGLITALFALGEYQAGLAHSQAAMSLEPDRATHRATAGLLWLGLGRVEEARQALRRAIELDPAEPAFRRALDQVGEAGDLEAIVARDWSTFRKE
jgi:Tfp pilus assembly protein PilF